MEPSSLLPAAVTLLVGLFGGGTITSIVQARTDRKKGIGELEVAQDDAIAQRWQAIVEAQAESLIAPLDKRIDKMKAEMEVMERKIESLETELTASRAKYWRAIMYIRRLQTYIIRHLPEGQLQPPDPPKDIADDI